LRTYVERDVRQLKNVSDLETFRRFLVLCAARTGQLLNYSSLAADTGISHPTAMGWISLLEASFIVHLLRPHHANFNKRLIKMPKLHFWDTGLACSLLGIESAEQLARHPLKGALFESWTVAELLKSRLHRGRRSNLFYWRDKTGHEIDALIDQAGSLIPVEVKAGKTVAADMFRDLLYWSKLAGSRRQRSVLIYGGQARVPRPEAAVVGWQDAYKAMDSGDGS
jgi:predicted AAA+ superfamily ATPase